MSQIGGKKSLSIKKSAKQAQKNRLELLSAKKLEIELRQQKIWRMRLQGLSQERIAEALDVDRRTVCRDLDLIKARKVASLKKMIDKFDAHAYWIKRRDELELMIEELWAGLVESKSDRSIVARTIAELRDEADKCLRSAGVRTTNVDPEKLVTSTIRVIHEDA